MQCVLSSEVHSVHNIFPLAEAKKIKQDACVGGNTQIPTNEGATQTTERKDFEVRSS